MPRRTVRPLAQRNAGAPALLTSLIVLLGLAGLTNAQPISMNPDDPAPTLIPFRSEPDLGEHVGRAEGVVDGSGKRFYLDGLDIMSPLVISVFSEDGSKPIDVSLHRFFWDDASREGRTNGEGDWTYAGRIHDEVGIEIRSEEATEYYILAWQGPAFEPSYGSVFAAASTSQGEASAGAGVWPLGLAAVFLVIGGLVLVRVLRRRGPASAALLVLALSASAQVVHADDLRGRVVALEGRLNSFIQVYNSSVRTQVEHHRRSNRDMRNLQRDLRIARDHLWEVKGELTGLRHYVEALSLETANDIARLQAAIEALQPLVEEDLEAIPDPSHGGVPPMESGCYTNPDCAVCFESVHAELRGQLRWHAELAAIFRSGDTYATSMAQFGDAHSGWHQLEQAEWYSQKQQITASHERLKTAYRNKLEDYNGRLYAILEGYGNCEQQFGLDDWFNRYGYPFYEALTASYRLP